jgi:hypothetical protein
MSFKNTSIFIYAFNMRTIYPVIYSKYLFIYFSEPHWWRKIVSVLSSSAVDRGFEQRSDQTEDYEIGVVMFFFIFVDVLWSHVTHFHVSECTNKILKSWKSWNIVLAHTKQQSADRHVAPLWHIILIPRQPDFTLSPEFCVLQNTEMQ